MNKHIAIAAVLTAFVYSLPVFAAQSSGASAKVEIVIKAPRLAEHQSVVDMIEALKKEGFIYIEVTRTFLGRARITAISDIETREIILNATTNEVLRNLAQNNPVTTHPPTASPSPEPTPDSTEGTADKPGSRGNNGGNSGGNSSGNSGGNNKGGLGNGRNAGGGRQN